MLKILQRSSLKIGRILFVTGLVLIFVTAVALFTLRYWVLPDIEKYHNVVTRLASRAIGLQVKIGKIEADLRWFRPHLVFTDIQLMDPEGRSALELRRVDNVVSWTTLLSGELRLQTLEIDDPDLLIRRDKQGILHVAGLQVSGHSEDGKLSDWLLHQSRIILNNGRITWQDDLYERPTLLFNQAELRLDNSGKHHRFAVRIAPPASVAAPLDARGDMVGESFSDWSDWGGELFAQISQADSGAWATWVNLPDEFSHAKGGLRAWMEIKGGHVNRITADLDMNEVQSRLATGLPLLNLASLKGRIGWHELERGFEVSTSKLSLEMANGLKLLPTDFHLRLAGKRESPFSAGEIQANALELADLSMMAEYIPLGKEFKQKLLDYSPSGHIADLHAQWQDAGRFDIQARFENMTVRRVGNMPGIEGLSGEVKGNDGTGTMSLNSQHMKLDAPQLFLEPIAFDTFSVQTGWEHKRDGWDVKLNNLAASNQDLSATAYGNYQTDPHGPGVADINLNLTRLSVQDAVKYVPKDLLGKATIAWCQSALKAGEAEDVHFRLRGDLNDFPFPQNKKGLFKVEAKIRDVVIDYAKDWPKVENGLGTVLMQGQRLQVESTSATLAGAKAQKVSISIPDITSADPAVQIVGESHAETKQALNFIKHSPIRGIMNGFTDNTTAVGEGKLDIKLDIPLTNKPVQLKGNYHFEDNEINLAEYIPLVKNVTGDITFTESAIQAKNISSQIYGGPASISAQTDASGAIKGKVQGRVNADAWHKIQPSSWFQSLNGTAEWNAEVTVQNKQFDVQVFSNLQGLSSNLPMPLLKHANEVIPLKFDFKSINSSQDLISVKYGDSINMKLMRADDKLGARVIKQGSLDFGSSRRVVDKDGIWVTGVLPLLSVEGWSGFIPSGNGREVPMPVIDGVDMTVQKLVGYSLAINGVSVHARNHNGTVTAQLMSKDLNGDATWFPQGKGKIVARLKNAVLEEAEKDQKKGNDKVDSIQIAGKALENISMPVIDVVAEHFTYLGKQLGRLELNASQIDKDILLDHFHLANSDGVMTVNGKWGLSPSQTHVVIKLELYDTGKMLNRSGYPNTLKDGNGVLDCDLVWAGAPNELALSNLDGHLSLKMSKGQFLKVDPGAGKLLSVMNLQSLPKRIALDFTDVFSKGFEFDDIEGVAQINQGMLRTSDFKINGSAAKVTMSGQVDLKRETQSLRVRVMPTIGGSVSLLAFAAGPAVGAGVFLANKIFRDPLDKLVSFEYNVTGGWVDPKVEKVSQVIPAPNNINN
jgi:uncharacterized protein (TIGR02099 family)